MPNNRNLSYDNLILEFMDLPIINISTNNDDDEPNNSFINIANSSQKYDELNAVLEHKYDEHHKYDNGIDENIQEDLQWNEETWLLESSKNSELISNYYDEDLLNLSFNTTFEKSRQSLEISRPEIAIVEDNDASYCISQSKLSSSSTFLDLNINPHNSAITNKKDNSENNAFYELPNKVKILIQKVKNINALYSWQNECLNLESVKKRQNLIYALPTSGGKTLVAEILMLKEVICNKKNVIFVLPYVAIVQEKIQSMAPFALDLEFLLEEYAGNKGQYPPVKRRRKNSIYICTIEKATILLNSLIENNRLYEIGLVVVDELHLIGESGGRGATLEGFLTKLMYINENIHIIGMSATIGNLDEIARFLHADLYTQNFRPVQLKEYIKCEDQIWLVDLHKEEIFTDEKRINYRYSDTASQLDPDRIGGLVMDIVPKDSCLIFCSTRKNCENVALLLTRVLFRSLTEYKIRDKEKLLNDLQTEGSLCPILSKTIKYGVAYHHSGLTAEERLLLEDAYRSGVICVICCTSTLAAGVNLPARRVILRSPYVGNEFLNLSRYKQMIGRAGRAGMGEIGESILICKSSEMPKVHNLLTSKMEDCISTLHIEEDRGMNNLLLSSVMLSIAKTRIELHKLISTSLLGVQSSRLGIDIKIITDSVIIKLIKDRILKVKDELNYLTDVTVVIPSQMIDNEIHNDVSSSVLQKNRRSITLKSTTILELSDLGKAAMKGSIDLHSAYTLYDDLKIAQNHLVLLDDLHILYLVTPYELANQLKPIGSVYYDVVSNLSSSSMKVARTLGINEVTIVKLRDGIIPKNIVTRVINRFYLALILNDLWQRKSSLYIIADNYQINRGVIQNLLSSAASFTMSIVRFCQELPEFWAFTELLSRFHKKLTHCCSPELELLMELPAVKAPRAKQLYNAGYKTLQAVASANPRDLQQKIQHLSRKVIDQIIAGANLLLLEKVENLKDEVAEMMEGMEASHF